MKKIIIVVSLCLFLGIATFAQEESNHHLVKNGEIRTLFHDGNFLHGYYLGISGGYAQVDNKDALTFGIKGAYLPCHNLAIGLAANVFADPNENLYYKNISGTTGGYLQGGYGGLLIEPILMPTQPVHIAFPILIGGGGAYYVNENHYNDHEWNWDDEDDNVIDDDAFFIVEPGMEVQMNIFKFMRFSVGASYRFTSGLDLQNSDSDMLNGFSTTASLRFGKF